MEDTYQCGYFVKRKKRFCRMTVKKGNKYCGEHQENPEEEHIFNETKIHDKRVKCPLDSTHTCYQSRLSKHMTVCNAKRLIDSQPAFVVKGINLEKSFDVPRHVPLSQVNQSVINMVLRKVNAAFEKLPQFPEVVLQHNILKDKINDHACGKDIRKHLLQNASLLAHLEHSGLVLDNCCFIEFGAGKGKLTYWLGQILKEKKDSCILLVDRSSHRHKSDNKLKNEQSPIIVKRIKADIADLNLNKITEIQKFEHKVSIAKHLCGAATDLTISCLVRAMQGNPKCNISGLIIAFCCHHKCEYASYVGKEYLNQCEFTPNEFTILCSIASWATCGSSLTRKEKPQNHCDLSVHSEINNLNNVETLSSVQRECIGRRVKSLLNWGRAEFLKSAGFRNDLLHYINTDVSLENMCIIATKLSV